MFEYNKGHYLHTLSNEFENKEISLYIRISKTLVKLKRKDMLEMYLDECNRIFVNKFNIAINWLEKYAEFFEKDLDQLLNSD